ncbi:hypothetical protein SAMN04487894_10496 [Niabella drilacis]|uniref:Uncharacterized protein n=1 Tax=Niabella drilacis (strain DSM 25811 / CCM 8410 / CCUG 62505 / LMG 26954 / E90) TaxID=1285928 RepID=A0A1G6PMD1_NIADE|nr:hypothetical protein SAMN04487894_10496 [Niabella drilacis]
MSPEPEGKIKKGIPSSLNTAASNQKVLFYFKFLIGYSKFKRTPFFFCLPVL